MARAYLSFLGTTNYLDCYYYRGDDPSRPEPDYPVRFVQEATILQNCKDWGPEDRIIIFTTKDAERTNWRNGGHKNRETHEPLDGLKTRLEHLQQAGLRVPFSNSMVPEGHTEAQVWEIFERLYDALDVGDDVVFDITHAFRSIPLLAVVVLQYGRIIKKVSLSGIYYGAFEVLGNLQKAAEIPVDRRRAPVVDLTALNALMDWSIATDRFLESGDVKSAGILAEKGVQGILRDSCGGDKAAIAITQLGRSLAAFNTMLTTCRGPEISRATLRLKQNTEKCRLADLPSPFRPLFERIRQRLEAFSGNQLEDGLAAVRWCVDHNLIQQGFTILEEILLSYVVGGVGQDPCDDTSRNIASQVFTIIRKGIRETPSLWHKPSKDNPELALKMVEFVLNHKDLDKTGSALQLLRNDLNHAGFGKDKKPLKQAGQFGKDLRKWLVKTEEVLKSHLWQASEPDISAQKSPNGQATAPGPSGNPASPG